ncbi:glycoside hydrolase family 78 protein [Virgisporangium aurantiacum]|uniref:alpha-L-rhamnosidase n=1 Tax=Virgisporangium aurantiacum TaxID=175570 RepID=A0A8J3Z3E1_9ACTN|nr:glycoside hydrolase family 78 protein [Virgisporangium aurantiacum]GIJ54555.1 alpha-L-rhamnosidase [Virgisporangium aurantiacum]
MSSRVVGLRAEHHRDPVGIGSASPRLSWRVESDRPGWIQSDYEIDVDSTVSTVEGPDQVLVPWPAAPLESRQRRTVRVRVRGRDTDEPSPWSEPLVVEAGLLLPGDWTARMIGPATAPEPGVDGPAVLLRREFDLPAAPVSARLYVTAHGVYELELNGARVGDHVLAPGWTSYRNRLRYQTFDVTGLLRAGANAVGGWLADGWFRGRLGFRGGRRDLYGERTGLLAQLEVTCADGSTVVVGTGEEWRTAPGPVVVTGLYDGEHHDARLEPDGWSAPGFDDKAWAPAAEQPFDPAVLVAPDGPPVRRTEVVRPVSIGTSPTGRSIVDFGQNITGRLRIRPSGPAGTTVTLRHAEVLQDGDLCVRPLRSAAATDVYTLRGTGGKEEWEPRFTVHGFRYAEIDGWLGEIAAEDVEAVVCHTDMTRTGWFTCSEPLLDRLHENVVWSMRGNFLDVPTDCPQRDERLGWTGDLAVFAPTAAFLYDCTGLLTSWLADLAAEQREYGTVPFYVPWVGLLGDPKPAAVWGDVAVTAPAVLHERTADVALLRAQYASMRGWVDEIADIAGANRLWDDGFQFGDWLDPAAPPDRPAAARTDPNLVATAALAGSSRTLARIAELLGEEADHRRYTDLADAVAAAFDDEFVTPNGRLASDAQTAYAMALTGDLLAKENQRERAGRRLVELVAAEGHHVGTGFAGTPLICDALTSVGAVDSAYHLVLQRECPSWLYPVTMGATTIWERWDSLLPDGTVNPGEMTSFNHYAFGAVADWLHRVVAGLAPAAPGYRRVSVRPLPGGGLTHASAAFDSPYGRIAVSWRRGSGVDSERLDVDVTVPPGVTAVVHLPNPSVTPVEVGSGEHRFTCSFRAPADDPKPPAPPSPF